MMLQTLNKYLGFDIRARALMRITVAFVILLDLSIRISDLEAFYSNTGVAPLAMILENNWNDYYFSFHTISGLWQVQLILFIVAAICALMLLIGYRTRLFTFLSWILLLSLHNRNTIILQGGDDLLRMILFWGMFIPWGKRYSCDRLLSHDPSTGNRLFTLGTLAYLLQITYVYSGSALLKGPEWHTSFTALYYTYSLDQIAYPVTKLIYFYPELLQKLTAIAFWLELLVPMLFFIPYKNHWFRLTGFILITGFHLWNGCTLLIGLFFIIGIASAIGLLPEPAMDFFDRITKNIKRSVAQSFSGIAAIMQPVIPWKAQQSFKQNRHTHLVFISLILYVLAWNLGNFSFYHYKLHKNIRFIGYTLRLDQNWGMFAPGVFKDDGWYVLEATTADKKKIDLFHPDKPVSNKKPGSIVSMFKNDRWRKYAENYIFVSNSYMRGYFCNYYMRKWNQQHPDQQIVDLAVIYYTELTLPDYHYAIPKKDVLCNCVY